MWKSVTSVLADGIKEFKDALIEDTPPSTPLASELEKSAALANGTVEPEQEAEAGQNPDNQQPQTIPSITAPAQPHTPIAPAESPANKDRAPNESWETLMLNNEIARLRQELEVARARIKELEAAQKECKAAPVDQDAVAVLQEENKLLKKTMKQLMNKVVPPPDKAQPHTGIPETPAVD